MINKMNMSQSSQAIIDSQLLQEIVKMKVELQKCRSQVQGYREMQEGYKKMSMRSELMQKQLLQYQQIMAMFFQRVNKFMLLLQIDSFTNNNNFANNNNKQQFPLAKYQSFNDSSQIDNNSINNNNINNNDESISFVNLKTEHSPAFSRRVKKLNSLKTIAQSYLSNVNKNMRENRENNKNMVENYNNNSSIVQFYQQDSNFSLIQSRIKQIMKENLQCRRTLDQYQKSCANISYNIKQNEVIVKKLQSEIRMKDRQVQQSQLQIGELLRTIEEMKEQLNNKQTLLINYQEQQQHVIKTYQQLSTKIQSLKTDHTLQEQNRNLQQEKINNVRKNCLQLIGQLQTTHDNYLLNYLMRDPLVIKSATQQSTPRSFNNNNNQYFSQSGKYNNSQQQHYSRTNSHKNKLQFVFD